MATVDGRVATCERCGRPLEAAAKGTVCWHCLLAARLGEGRPVVGAENTGPREAMPDLWAETAESLPLIGSKVGPYRILNEIGRGGMGVVYRARHEQLDRLVAIKTIIGGGTAPPLQLKAFLSEARAAARVRHPNIIGVYEVGQIGGNHFMAMEFVEGRSLLAIMQSGPMRVEDAARIVRDIASALSHLHRHGIVHRDVKPSNILVDRDGTPYITDFGLARFRVHASGHSTDPVLAGTPSYMSPEQATGSPGALAPRTDVYSLGAVLYQALTGRPPFQGGSVPETLMRVVKREPASPKSIRPELPAALDRICLKCLEKNPNDRYPGMDELSADLNRYLGGESTAVSTQSMAQHVRRWWRKDPILSARFIALWLFFLVEQIWYVGLGETSRSFYLTTTLLIPVWALVSYVFTVAIRRSSGNHQAIRSLWITADTLFLTGILLSSEGLQQSPLVMLFPVYIVSAGLWNRVRAVWLATLLCISSSLMLWLYAPWINPARAEPLHVHVVFAACLVMLAFLVSHHVQQIRTMRRYLRQQP